MHTRILPTDPSNELKASALEAVALLEKGEVVALPTETVYGLAGDLFSAKAIDAIFAAKERPAFDPLIVHLPRRSMLEEVAEIPEEIAKDVARLIEAFWPGPLTLILPKKPCVSDAVTAGLPTVAVRMSSDPVFKRVIHDFGRPLAAPSANRFGRLSPTSASAVKDELDGRIPLILDGGACSSGLESTIIKITPGKTKPEAHILRAGPVTAEELKVYCKVIKPKRTPVTVEGQALESPGQTASHYAPGTPLRLLSTPDEFTPEEGKRYALLSYRGDEDDGYLRLADFEEILVLSPGSGKVPEAAVRFFYLLRQLDQLGVDEILAEPVPERGIGVAIMDRLRRAAAKRA